jgi:hypothetical protein
MTSKYLEEYSSSPDVVERHQFTRLLYPILKNIGRPVRVFRVRDRGAAASQRSALALPDNKPPDPNGKYGGLVWVRDTALHSGMTVTMCRSFATSCGP